LNIKLKLIKETVNKFVPLIRRITPKKKANHKVSHTTVELCGKMEELILQFQRDGDIIPIDDNFLNLLRAVRDAVVYVCEEDNFYRSMLETFYTLVYLKKRMEIEI